MHLVAFNILHPLKLQNLIKFFVDFVTECMNFLQLNSAIPLYSIGLSNISILIRRLFVYIAHKSIKQYYI